MSRLILKPASPPPSLSRSLEKTRLRLDIADVELGDIYVQTVDHLIENSP